MVSQPCDSSLLHHLRKWRRLVPEGKDGRISTPVILDTFLIIANQAEPLPISPLLGRLMETTTLKTPSDDCRALQSFERPVFAGRQEPQV
mmetsp:Transcript_20347/g.44258  ORF Transcript_20347/g.44258 Transcript_20347/m.44258 type:complete len:90 (-) Transcript_20347:247-516(-)